MSLQFEIFFFNLASTNEGECNSITYICKALVKFYIIFFTIAWRDKRLTLIKLYNVYILNLSKLLPIYLLQNFWYLK